MFYEAVVSFLHYCARARASTNTGDLTRSIVVIWQERGGDMKKLLTVFVAGIAALSLAACAQGVGKGKGKAPAPVVTKG